MERESMGGLLSVDACGLEECAPGHQYGPAVREYYLIHCVFSGRGEFRAGGRSHPVGTGQGFVIFPHQVTVYRADERVPWHYGWMGYSGALAAQLTQRAGLEAERPVFEFSEIERLRGVVEQARDDIAGLRMGEESAVGGLLRFLAHIGQGTLPQGAAEPTQADAYFRRASWYIEANLVGGVQVDEVARFVGLCRSQLFRVFRQAAGCSPQQWIAQARLRRAEQLLTKPGLSLKEVALSCGYSGAAQMGKAFREQLGAPPGAYRRQLQQDGKAESSGCRTGLTSRPGQTREGCLL